MHIYSHYNSMYSRSRNTRSSYQSSRYSEDFLTDFGDFVEDSRTPLYSSNDKQSSPKKNKRGPAMSKFSPGDRVYVKRYNPNNGKWTIFDGEVISSTLTKKNEISYTWLSLQNGKTYKALETEMFRTYSEAEESKRMQEVEDNIAKNNKANKSEVFIDPLTGEVHTVMSAKEALASDDWLPVKSFEPTIEENVTSTLNDMQCQLNSLKDEMVKITAVPASDCAIAINTTGGDLIARTNDVEVAVGGIQPRMDYIENRVADLEKSQKKTKKLIKLGAALLLGGI